MTSVIMLVIIVSGLVWVAEALGKACPPTEVTQSGGFVVRCWYQTTYDLRGAGVVT